MLLHDHPNMSVFFKLMFGKLDFYSYDKLEDKFRFNNFSLDEYQEYLETKKVIYAKQSNKTIVSGS